MNTHSGLYGGVNMDIIKIGFLFFITVLDIRSIRIRFISQIENIKRVIGYRLKLSNLELPLYNITL